MIYFSILFFLVFYFSFVFLYSIVKCRKIQYFQIKNVLIYFLYQDTFYLLITFCFYKSSICSFDNCVIFSMVSISMPSSFIFFAISFLLFSIPFFHSVFSFRFSIPFFHSVLAFRFFIPSSRPFFNI